MANATYYDLPFIYVYDGDALTDSVNYADTSVLLLNNSDFILRRICGVNNLATTFRYRDSQRMNRIQSLSLVNNDIVSVPESLYPAASQIGFDLGNVARANNTGGGQTHYFSQIGFQGVRRFYGVETPESNYRYYDRPYTIRFDFTIADTGLASPLQYNVQVPDRDFELLSIVALIDTSGGAFPQVMASHDFKITLYDAKQNQLSNAPVVDEYICANGPDYNSIFPVPTIWYPVNSVIRFDIQSLLLAAQVPASVTLLFNGLWRFPC